MDKKKPKNLKEPQTLTPKLLKSLPTGAYAIMRNKILNDMIVVNENKKKSISLIGTEKKFKPREYVALKNEDISSVHTIIGVSAIQF